MDTRSLTEILQFRGRQELGLVVTDSQSHPFYITNVGELAREAQEVARREAGWGAAEDKTSVEPEKKALPVTPSSRSRLLREGECKERDW